MTGRAFGASALKPGPAGMFRIPEIRYRQPIYYKANRLAVIGHTRTFCGRAMPR